MKIIRFESGGQKRLGKWLDHETAQVLEGDLLSGALNQTSQVLPIDKLLYPLDPTDILCIGLNYRQHAIESKAEVPPHPLLFIKPSNTLNNPFGSIPIPRLSKQIDFEGELVIVIGKTAKHVPRDQALKYVLGYTVANDVSARDWQRDKNLGGGQFARGKGFDGFCPMGPCLVTADEIPNPNNLRLKTTLNGQLMQDSSTADMIYDVPSLIASLSSTMTLFPGAVILTGTPQGVGMGRNPPLWMKAGDRVIVEVEKIGSLENSVTDET